MAATRPSPSRSAANTNVGTVQRGADGARWIVKELAGGVHRWVRLPEFAGRSYLTHDNGGVAYRVVVAADRVAVFERDAGFEEDVFLKKVLEVRRPKKVHAGTYRGSCRGYASPSEAGNSVLIQVDDARFIFVGTEIFRFSIADAFEAFFSPIGNSDVPYPWLVGSERVYLMEEKVVLPRQGKAPADPYADFYGMPPKELAKLRRQSPLKVKTVHQRPR